MSGFEIFPLPLFPPASLDSSVTTTVWVGVLVVAFFNLRLGWIFSGLVVPGYLVPLLLARPVSAVVVVVEALIVYVLAKWISDGLPRGPFWSSFFGRDRFFFLIVLSVLVRLTLDGWVLPRVALAIEQRVGINLDLGNELQSFGLVIVALMANQLWKPGLVAGLGQMATTVGITFVAVRGVLMEWTNFDIGALEYMYEDIAASILASPKAYVILLTTAFIASRLNLLYGWEYSGVLIPALLALQWYEPVKLAASIVEAWAVLLIGGALLESRWFRGSTIEKARKVAVFFSVSYAYKYVIAYALLLVQPEVKVSDLYGFGYLLPSLLAVKMHEKNLGLRMTRFTIQTTVVSALVSLLVGFGLTLVPRRSAEVEPASVELVEGEHRSGEVEWAQAVLDARIRLNAARGRPTFEAPSPGENAELREVVAALFDAAEGRGGELPLLRARLAGLGYGSEWLSESELLVEESDPSRGWGLYLIRFGEASNLLIEAPRPHDEWATAQAALRLYAEFRARAVALAGSGGVGIGDASRRIDHAFHAFHREAARPTLQVRESALPDVSTLWAQGDLPGDLDLREVERLAGSYSIRWEAPAEPSLQWRTSGSRFAELHLSRDARHRLLLAPRPSAGAPEPTPYEQPIEGYLHRWLLAGKGRIAGRGSEVYRPASIEELHFFDEEVLKPILRVVRDGYRSGQLNEIGRTEWRRAALAASHFDYETIWYRHQPSGQDYLVLQESDPATRYWGTYAFRLGLGKPFFLSVPRPRSERRTFEVGVSLFEQLRATTLAVAGAHPYANSDASSDLIRDQNKASLFNLVHQVSLREARNEERWVVLCRAFAETGAENEPDAMLAVHDGAHRIEELGPLGRQLFATLGDAGIEAQFVDGSPETASYEVGATPQVRYLDQTVEKSLAVLWLSASTRGSFRVDSDEKLRTGALAELGIPAAEEDVEALIASSAPAPIGAEAAAEIRDLLSHYLLSADRLALGRLGSEFPWLRLRQIYDRNSPRVFLVASDAEERFVAAVNLQLRTLDEPVVVRGGDLSEPAREFVQRRRALLTVGAGR